jgi:hypothetical protein
MYFWMGQVRLSDGDRAGARESFEKCLATRWVSLTIRPYVRAFLARMERDPDWPSWIPPKK